MLGTKHTTSLYLNRNQSWPYPLTHICVIWPTFIKTHIAEIIIYMCQKILFAYTNDDTVFIFQSQ